MSRKTLRTAVAALAALSMPLSLSAHRQWILPSSTVLSSQDAWVTIDAAVSNELFYFDHVPMRLSNLVVTAPNGAPVSPENIATGKYRSTFDVHLTEPGTYRIASVGNFVFASWEENGEQKRWRGSEEAFAKQVPADAKNLTKTKNNSRVETFVTAGSPTKIKPVGEGLEMVALTHPNDLVTGEAVEFQFLANGKPEAGLTVSLIPGGNRYRDQLHEQQFTTDGEGKIEVTFDEPGMYWINASKGGGRRGPGGPGRGGDRMSYTATLEVLPL